MKIAHRVSARGRVFGVAAGIVLTALAIAACSSDDTASSSSSSGSSSGAPVDGGITIVDAKGAEVDAGLDASAKPDAAKDAEPPPEEGPPSGLRDRAGRAYVTRLLVTAKAREAYNQTAVDQDPPDGGLADFQAGLALLDALDGTEDWPAAEADAGHPLAADWLGSDALLLDPNKPFAETGYLDLEANGDAALTCGGRWPGDDALDKTLSFLVGNKLTGVSDGVDAPAKAPTLTFPYLAEPF